MLRVTCSAQPADWLRVTQPQREWNRRGNRRRQSVTELLTGSYQVHTELQSSVCCQCLFVRCDRNGSFNDSAADHSLTPVDAAVTRLSPATCGEKQLFIN